MKKIGLFGGSFDPVHIGHISIASLALNELDLDEVQFIPTGHNPWKDDNHTDNTDNAYYRHDIGAKALKAGRN